MAKKEDPREISVYEIVDLIEEFKEYHWEPSKESTEEWSDYEAHMAAADKLIAKLVGPERQSESRWSSKHIRVDEPYCEQLADSLGISKEEAYDFFIGEPVKYAEVIASWALDQVDFKALGENKYGEPDHHSNGPRVHLQRGRAVADLLQAWAYNNQRGVYRQQQEERQATPVEERV